MKRFVLTLIVLLFLSLFYQSYQPNNVSSAKTLANFSSQNSTYTELFPIKQNNKWGYIDKFGQIVIKPKYLAAQAFSENIAFVRTSKHIKAIDNIGNTIFSLPLISNFPGVYSEGLAPISVNGKYGFIDTKGKLVIDLQFDFAEPFSEGLALVKIGNNYGFIDKEGKPIFEPHFAAATSFSDGLAAIRLNKTDKYPFFIDRVIEVICYLPSQATKSFIKTSISHNTYFDILGRNQSIITNNLTGNFNATVSFEKRAFSQDLVSVRINNQYGYINKEGKIVIDPQFAYADAFSNGLAQVSIKGKCAFINQSGAIVINTPYDYYNCSCFSNGLAKIQIGGQVGYIDKNGQFVWPLTD
jgi:hypothetical protein